MEKLRLKVQAAFLVLFNIGVFKWQFICFPVLNCHSCPLAVFACPIGIIGQFAGIGLVALTALGGIALAGLLVGRFLCGWACPFGFFQELLYKVPYVKFSIPEWTKFIKYGVFLGMVVAVPIIWSTDFPLFFCRVCPVATIESAVPWAIMQGSPDTSWLAVRLSILFALIILMMGHRRFFCKVICPLGACLSVFNRFAIIFPEQSIDCTECRSCSKVCPMQPEAGKRAFGAYAELPEECISCLACQEKCPTESIRIWGG